MSKVDEPNWEFQRAQTRWRLWPIPPPPRRHDLRVAVEATSLGGVETLASLPFNSSHFNMTDDERLEAGIMPGMVRLAIGIEGHDVLASDLRQALDAARN